MREKESDILSKNHGKRKKREGRKIEEATCFVRAESLGGKERRVYPDEIQEKRGATPSSVSRVYHLTPSLSSVRGRRERGEVSCVCLWIGE